MDEYQSWLYEMLQEGMLDIGAVLEVLKGHGADLVRRMELDGEDEEAGQMDNFVARLESVSDYYMKYWGEL